MPLLAQNGELRQAADLQVGVLLVFNTAVRERVNT